jgi:isoquinoline 1-oxidoreductase beta subunit
LVVGAPFLKTVQLFAAENPGSFRPSIWLAIAADGEVTIVTHRSEMGTGIRTCLRAVVADELEADMDRVTIEQALGDEMYGSQNTDGSRSVRDFFQTMREVGATARHMLEAAAAQTWGVPASQCRASAHAVHHARSGRSLSFGDLATSAAEQAVPSKASVALKPRSEWRYIGQDFPIHDGPAIVRGEATYGGDVRLPGMKFAAVLRAPDLGGTLASHDATAALEVPGVEQVLVLPGFKGVHSFQALGGVAVIARSTWAAFQGRRALQATWEPGPNAGYDSTAFRETLLEAVRKPGRAIRSQGYVDGALAGAEQRLEADYTTPLLAHASMEPPVATAHVTAEGCQVWAPNQNPQAARDTVAASLGLDKGKVKIHTTLLGGGFGRKSKPDFIAEAALLSRQVQAPVQVVWSREDDLEHDYYHAPAAVRCEAGLGATGNIEGMRVRTAFSSITSTFAAGSKTAAAFELGLGATDLPYAVKDFQLQSCEAPAHVRIGWMRSVCNIFHAFAASSFVDELAHAAGRDSAEFLLEALGEPRALQLGENVEYPNYDKSLDEYPIDVGRLRGVVEAVKAKAWGRKLAPGHALGIAAHRSFHASVAVVVEAGVDEQGVVQVPRVDLAIDLGTVVNPDRVHAQMEGSVVFGLSLALQGEITTSKGRAARDQRHHRGEHRPSRRGGRARRTASGAGSGERHLRRHRSTPPGPPAPSEALGERLAVTAGGGSPSVRNLTTRSGVLVSARRPTPGRVRGHRDGGGSA